MNKGADQPKGPDSQEQEQPKIGQEKLQEILGQHKRWVDSEGKEGTRARLSGANLQGANLRGANLRGANLQKADLSEANLQMADLSGANLQKADLSRANLQKAVLGWAKLQKAELYKANLQGANLYRAQLSHATLLFTNLREANLQNATLEDVSGLQARQLAGANVSGAKLPKDIHEFEALDNVAEASKNARKIFIAVLLGCVYSWLTIATTTDARLLTNSSSSPLPIIQTPVPIAGFYWAAPFLLLCMFVYLHLYLQRLWDGLSKLPAVFPDGRPLDERAYPWMLNGLVRAHFKLLREEKRPLFSRFQALIVIVLAWWLVPCTLLLFWWRYLPRRDGWLWEHYTLVVIAISFAISFQLSARRTLRGQPRQPLLERWKEASEQVEAKGRIKAWGSFLSYAFDSALPARVALAVALVLYVLTPAAMEKWPADLTNADVSTKPANWTGTNKQQEIDLVKGADLSLRDLRNAEASRAFLVKANLRAADLLGANLREANLRSADLTGADLQGADLTEVDLRNAQMTCQGGFLEENCVNLERAKLRGAKLQDANLSGAKLNQAKLDCSGDLGTGPCTKLNRAILTAADLSSAVLDKSDLSNAVLRGANLEGAKLRKANLTGAHFGCIQGSLAKGAGELCSRLKGAILEGTILSGVDLSLVDDLTQLQLGPACGDNTRLPPNLEIEPCK